MDEGRKRVIGIIAGILVANHMDVADDLFAGKSEPVAFAVLYIGLGAYALIAQHKKEAPKTSTQGSLAHACGTNRMGWSLTDQPPPLVR
jgi:hypothetical protein